jgi:hypothetical protein
MRTALLLLPLLLLPAACGRTGSTAPASEPFAVGDVSLSQVLAELEALPVPDGADPQAFAALKAAAREMLSTKGVTRFASAAPQGPLNQVQDLTSAYTDEGKPGVQWNYKNVGDYDFNGEVNINDLSRLGAHLGKGTNSPDWDIARFTDGDGNGLVTIADLTPIGANFRSRVWSWALQGSASPDGPWTELGDVSRVSGAARQLESGMLIYIIEPAQVFEYYRVIPQDNLGNQGIPSNVSVQFIISEQTRVVGAEGGPQFASRSGNRITLTPGTETPPLVPGDIIVGSEQGGYLLRVDSVTPSGNNVVVEGSPAAMTDVFIQGGIGTIFDNDAPVQAKAAASHNPPPPELDFDLGGQVLADEPGLNVTILDGVFNYLPAADVAINYNKYGGVTYLRALLRGEQLKFNVHARVSADNFSGTFPATEAQRPFFEKKYTSLTFSFVTQQNGVPVVLAAQYDIYLGVEGSGALSGFYEAQMEASYHDILQGGIFNPDGLEEFSQFTPLFNSAPAPVIEPGGGDFQFRVYVRPEVHTRLYGNPIPGNSEDLDLRSIPFMQLAATRTDSPDDGYDYVLSGGMDTSYKLALNHMGLPSQVQQNYFADPGTVIKAGFDPDVTVIPTYSLIGAINETGTGLALPDIKVVLLNADSGQVIGNDFTDVNGNYGFADLLEDTRVTVRPSDANYDFTPLEATFTMDGNKVQGFQGTFDVPD